MRDRIRTLSPKKSGELNGKFTPSLMGAIKVEKNGSIDEIPMNRADRRKLHKLIKGGKMSK